MSSWPSMTAPLLGLLIGVPIAVGAEPPPKPAARPSLVLVTMDTTRPDHLQPYGGRAETPVLAKLADEGALFEQARAVAPLTLPGHTAILTGLDPPQSGVRNNGTQYVPADVTTLAERLRARGWRTAAFVSALVLERRYGLDQGFEVYDDDLSTGRSRHPFMVPDRPAEATVAAARAWLDTLPPDAPFFLWVHFYDPHFPYAPPPPYADRYRSVPYDGEIAYMDAELGRLLAHPRLASQPAVVMALADHGESLGEHGELTHGILAYDATLHIPWIVKVPGAPAGARIPELVSQIDVVPTVLDLLGLPADHVLPGRSLAGLLRGAGGSGAPASYGETYLPFYTYGWAELRVLWHDGWKLIDAPTRELYDLRRDPRELSNLAEREPTVARRMQDELDRLRAQIGSPERETTLEIDPTTAERLRSLGYVAVGTPTARDERATRPDPKAMIGLHVGLERARVFMVDHVYDAAEKALDAVLERDPMNLAALVDLVTVLEEQGRLDDAAETLTRALALDPGYARLYMIAAELEKRRNRPAAALAQFDRAIELAPRFPEAKVGKAYVLDQLDRDDEAADVLRAALRDDDRDPETNAAYAQIVELYRGDLKGAEARLRAAVARDPFLEPAWRLLGVTLERAGRAKDAADAYREALRRVPDSADAHARLGVLLGREQLPDEAEPHLREAIRLSPGFRADLHVALGASLADRGRFDEALAEYAAVLATDPKNAAARNNRAVALYHSGRLVEANDQFRALLVEQPRNVDAHNNRAVIALDRDDWPLAATEARAALDVDPRAVPAWSNLGVALDGQGRYAEAEQAFRRALELAPTDLYARRRLATTLRKVGRAKEAAELFEEVLQQTPADSELHLELGDLYFTALHDRPRARAHYGAVLRYAPDHPRAAEIRERRSGNHSAGSSGPS